MKLPRVFHDYPLGILLVALLLMIVGAPLTADLGAHVAVFRGSAELAPFTTVLTLAAAYAIWPLAKYRAMAIALAGLMLSLLAFGQILLHHQLLTAHYIGQVIFLLYVIAVLARTVFKAPIVDGNILCGAACVYLLIGVMCGFIYTLVDLFFPGSFVLTLGDGGSTSPRPVTGDAPGWFVYFSFTTLTTVGFGDIVPDRQLSRSLAVLEAVVGQIMLVVMIARLVGLHVAHTSSRTGGAVPFEVGEGSAKTSKRV